MRRIVNVIAGEKTDLRKQLIDLDSVKIKKLWTIYDEKELWDSNKFNPYTGKPIKHVEDLVLEHRQGVFIEDNLHDYKVADKFYLVYNSRVTKIGNTAKVLLEIEPKKEVERKFLLTDFQPTEFDKIDEKSIKQTYVNISDDIEERVRFIKSNDGNQQYTHTIKKGNGLSRTEIEKNISFEEYNEILKNNTDIALSKKRVTGIYDNHIVEIDIYDNYLKPLSVVEIEFCCEIEANNFQPFEWLGKEVTEDKKYKNKNLWKSLQ